MNPLASRRFWVGVALGLVCLWLALRNVPFSALGNALAGASYVWLVPAVLLQLVALVARAQRWVVLLQLGREKRLGDSFWSQGMGYLFSNVLPLRLGEAARVLVMSDRCNLPIMQVAASAMVERLLDVATMVLALVLVLPLMAVPELIVQAGTTFGVVVLLIVVGLLVVVRFSGFGEQLLALICGRIPFLSEKAGDRVIALWQELVSGLAPLTHWSTAAQATLWSVATWGFSILVYWCVLQAFTPQGALIEATFMVIALAFSSTVPSSPGMLGIYQLVGQQALVLPFGGKYDDAAALAITLTAHLTVYLTTTSPGVVALWKLGQSFGRLSNQLLGARGRGTGASRVTVPASPQPPADS